MIISRSIVRAILLNTCALFLAQVASPAWGQVTTNIRVTAWSRTTARLEWSSASGGAQQVYYGPTLAYGRIQTSNVVFNGSKYSAVLTGLPPGQSTYFCPTPVGSPPLQECQDREAAFSVRTNPGPPIPAKAPRGVLGTQVSVNGSVFSVAGDCSNLQQMINAAAAATPDRTHEVRIPAGALCSDRYTLPERPSWALGWVIIKGDAPESSLPARNSQVDASYEAHMPIIRSNYVSVYFWNTPPSTCSLGEFWYNSSGSAWGLHKCVNTGGGWELIPAKASGTTVPSTCSLGDWFHKTDAGDPHRKGFWCTSANRYEPVYMDNGGNFSEYAAVRAGENSNKYQFIGVQITHIPLPLPYAAQFNTPGSRKKGNTSGCLVWTPESSKQIVFDRVWFRGQGYPSSLWYGFCKWDGRHQVIKNSLFSEVNRWLHPSSQEDDSRAINIEAGPGPALVENNTFENVVGVTIYFSDDLGPNALIPGDYVIRRNRFLLSDAYNAKSPQSNGRYYYRRHHLELKRGLRVTVEGNIFDGGWSAVNQGATVMLTPRIGNGTTSDSKVGITDFAFRNNIVRNTPQFAVAIGHADGPPAHPITTQRIQFQNNLFTGLSGQRTGWGGNAAATGLLLNTGLGMEDLFLENNTVLDSVAGCCTPNFLHHAWSDANAGLVLKNNVFTAMNSSSAGIWNGGTSEGTPALDLLWNENGKPSHIEENNFFARMNSLPTNYPAGIKWGLSASALGIASDGSRSSTSTTYGADVTQLKKVARITENLRIERVGADTASAIFKVFTVEEQPTCVVNAADNPLFRNAISVVDSSFGTDKVIQVRGLRAGGAYFFRVSCDNQPQIVPYQN